jgi:hypothetical protein
MKKKMKKLTLNRETVRSLDSFRRVVGGTVNPTDGIACTHALGCTPTQVGTKCVTGTGSYGTCGISNLCSGNCETGGACTLTCANC